MDDNFFDPTPDMASTPSPNLPQDDPLRDWASQLQDPELQRLMASNPQAAVQKMIDMGIPPPPPQIHQYAEGGLGDEKSRTMAVPTQTVGGAPLPPPMVRTNIKGGLEGNITDLDPAAYGGTPGMPAEMPPKSLLPKEVAQAGLPVPDPRKAAPAAVDPGFDPEPEVNPNPQTGVPTPMARPAGAPTQSTDVSSINKKADALDSFGKSLSGVKPVAPPAPNYVGTPSVRSPGSVNAPSLQNLLGLVGQPAPSPLGLTLGRLLQSGKA